MTRLAHLIGSAALAFALTAAAQTPAPSDEALRAEIVFWETIRASSDPADFRAYLEQYPNGKFAPLARNRISALERKPVAAPEPAPAAATNRPLPQKGDTWTYRLIEPKRTDGPKERTYVATVTAAGNTQVTEQFTIDQEPTGEAIHKGDIALMGLGRQLLSPYLYNLGAGVPTHVPRVRVAISDPACSRAYVCEAIAFVAAWEKVRVPAGEFESIKVEVRENWRSAESGSHMGAQMQGGRILHVWYAPVARRAVKFRSRPTFGAQPPIETEFDLELVKYELR